MASKREVQSEEWPPAKAARTGEDYDEAAVLEQFAAEAEAWPEVPAVAEASEADGGAAAGGFAPEPLSASAEAISLVAEAQAAAASEKGTSGWQDTLLPGSEPPEGLAFGYVKKTHPEKGFSFLLTDPNDEASTVYVHRSVCDPHKLAVAEAVAYKTHYNKKGEAQASAPVWLLMGPVPEDSVVSWCDHVGVVSRVREEGGVWIDCDALAAAHGKEAFCDAAVVQLCTLIEGDTIRFDVELDECGQLQIKAPVWKLDGGARFKGASTLTKPSGADVVVPSGETLIGRVDMMNHMKGFGFLSSPSLPSSVHVHIGKTSADVDQLAVGDLVAFKILPPKSENNKPEAVHPIYKRVGQSPKGDSKGDDASAIGEYSGQIGKVMANGSGFVDCEEAKAAHGREVYIHADVLRKCGLSVGDTISFDVHINSRGQPQVSAPCWKRLSGAMGKGGKGGKGKMDLLWGAKGMCGKGGKGGKDWYGSKGGSSWDWGAADAGSWYGGGGGGSEWGGSEWDDGWSGAGGGGWPDWSSFAGLASMMMSALKGKGKGKDKGKPGKGKGKACAGKDAFRWGEDSWAAEGDTEVAGYATAMSGVSKGVPAAFAAMAGKAKKTEEWSDVGNEEWL